MSSKPYEDALAIDLHTALDAIIRRGALPRVLRRLNEMTGFSFGRSTYWLAVRLAETDGIRLPQLADKQGADLSTISRQFQTGEQADLVERRPDSSDTGATLVSLTPFGHSMLDRRHAALHEIILALAGWTAEKQDTFAHLLSRFAARFHDWAVNDTLVESTIGSCPSS